MKGQVSSIVADLRFVLGGGIRAAANGGLPTLGQLVQVDVFSGGCHGCCLILRCLWDCGLRANDKPNRDS